MALTEPATRSLDDDAPADPPVRRSLLSRLSAGHVVMILTGLVAVLLNLAFLRTSGETIEVIVAARSLPAGTVLTAGDIQLVELGDAGALTGGLISAEAAAGTYGATVARELAAGEPIRPSDLRPAGTLAGLREYSLELDAARAAAGRIGPADVVDVIATIDGRSSFVASTVEVISVSTDNSTLGVGDELIVVLGVDDRTALEIASAESVGSITLVRATGAEPPGAGPVTARPEP